MRCPNCPLNIRLIATLNRENLALHRHLAEARAALEAERAKSAFRDELHAIRVAGLEGEKECLETQVAALRPLLARIEEVVAQMDGLEEAQRAVLAARGPLTLTVQVEGAAGSNDDAGAAAATIADSDDVAGAAADDPGAIAAAAGSDDDAAPFEAPGAALSEDETPASTDGHRREDSDSEDEMTLAQLLVRRADEASEGEATESPRPRKRPRAAASARRTSSRFFGVCFSKASNKWQAQYRNADRKLVWIGLFTDEEEAARAYNRAITDNNLESLREINPVVAGRLVEKPSNRGSS